MPHARGALWARFRVTVAALVAAAILSVIVYLLTGGTLLQEKTTLYLYMPDATGLGTGTPVRVNGTTVGKVGVGVKLDEHAYDQLFTQVRYAPIGALQQALARTWETSALTLKMLGKMIVGEVSIKNLSGPITIADYAGQSAQMGWLAYMSFIALISISLGVLNLLPVPVLDGGHLMYYIAEIITGRPVSERALEIGQRIGMVVLFSLMAFAIYNDIYRLVGG